MSRTLMTTAEIGFYAGAFLLVASGTYAGHAFGGTGGAVAGFAASVALGALLGGLGAILARLSRAVEDNTSALITTRPTADHAPEGTRSAEAVVRSSDGALEAVDRLRTSAGKLEDSGDLRAFRP
jgi:hypothetical protein